MFFVDHVVTGHDLGFARLRVHFFTLFELGDDAIHLVVLVGGLFARTRNDERSPGFVDEDGIDFVDDRKVMNALYAIAQVELHVVAEIVPSCRTMPPINCTSKWRILSTRRPASRTTANASSSSSSRTALSASSRCFSISFWRSGSGRSLFGRSGTASGSSAIELRRS